MNHASTLRTLERTYRKLAGGDRVAVFDLLEPGKGGLAYEGQKTVLYATLSLLDWMESLGDPQLALTIERNEAASRLTVSITVSGRGVDTKEPVTFAVSHLWEADGCRMRFQWFNRECG